MIHRKLEAQVQNAAAHYPSVTIFGPRQSGKTTLAKTIFPNYSYANLEDSETRSLASSDYRAFFSRFPPPVIIDEAQKVPEIASAVQVLIDENRSAKGRFVLTGSHQPLLAQAVSQSLAGRTSVLTLFPPEMAELGKSASMSSDAIMCRGFMPELYSEPDRDAFDYYRNYYALYVERDVRQMVNVKDLLLFDRFVRLLAGRIGQLANFQSLAVETGVSAPTISQWVSVLEASFLVFRLPPYFLNISKRLVKAPKIYFSDVGLAAYLLGIENERQMMRDPLRGHLFENLVVADVMKHRINAGREPNLYFLRTEKGFEIDLLQVSGREIWPMEIKSAMTWRNEFASAIRRFVSEVPGCVRPAVIYDGDKIEFSDGVKALNFRDHWVE